MVTGLIISIVRRNELNRLARQTEMLDFSKGADL